MGAKNPNFKYKMHDKQLDNVKQENDLSVMINNNFRMSDQYTAASKENIFITTLRTKSYYRKSTESKVIVV